MKNDEKDPRVKHYPGAPIPMGNHEGQMRDEKHPNQTELVSVENKYQFLFFELLGLLFIILAFAFDSPGEIWRGSLVILTSPANLLTDYFRLANIGATLLNVGLMTLLSVALIRLNHIPVSGSIVAAVFTMLGFSFFGKNLYNTIPIILGVYVYSKAVRRLFGHYILHCLFGTALSPLVSEFSFNLGLPLFSGVILGVAAGMLAGFVLVPLSLHTLRFHQGFSLYNIGFTAGIIGMLFTAILRGFGVEINAVSILSEGHNPEFSILLYGLFLVLLLLGLWANRWRLKGFGRLLALPGMLPTDFLTAAGLGITLVNMAMLGILSVTYVLVLGGELNGPVIGGIFTVVGFGAYGKHIKNAIPILVGVTITNFLNIHESNSSYTLMAALFGTTLAPIAGRYGVFAGILAGFLHMSLVTNIGFLHAGMNLYNNGFSGGFIAAFLCPVLDAAAQIKQAWKQ